MITAEELLKIAPPSAKRNYEHNKKMRAPIGQINGQQSCRVSKYRFGLRKMSSNGCGAIAVFNALLCAGHEPDFHTIALGLEIYALRIKGLLGVNPDKMDRFFKECRIAAIKAQSYDDFLKVMGAVKVGILCYWVAKPKASLLHFVAVINNGDGTYSVCNRYANRKTPSAIPSIEKLCTKEQYVAGFFIN